MDHPYSLSQPTCSSDLQTCYQTRSWTVCRLPSFPQICGTGSSLPSSPRRFANHGLVYLSEIETLEDLNELSTKQIKDLLAMNRVNFKGCVEKEELLKILQRLWKQDRRNKENIETMDDDSLCKICMDSPVV